MDVRIPPFDDSDIDALVERSLLAWGTVFAAWERILGVRLYPIAIDPDCPNIKIMGSARS